MLPRAVHPQPAHGKLFQNTLKPAGVITIGMAADGQVYDVGSIVL